MSKKIIIGNHKVASYEHDKRMFPYSKKSYQKSRNKKARKRYYRSVWEKYWTAVDWNIFWDFVKLGC